jgi:hypothetical protein
MKGFLGLFNFSEIQLVSLILILGSKTVAVVVVLVVM